MPFMPKYVGWWRRGGAQGVAALDEEDALFAEVREGRQEGLRGPRGEGPEGIRGPRRRRYLILAGAAEGLVDSEELDGAASPRWPLPAAVFYNYRLRPAYLGKSAGCVSKQLPPLDTE